MRIDVLTFVVVVVVLARIATEVAAEPTKEDLAAVHRIGRAAVIPSELTVDSLPVIQDTIALVGVHIHTVPVHIEQLQKEAVVLEARCVVGECAREEPAAIERGVTIGQGREMLAQGEEIRMSFVLGLRDAALQQLEAVALGRCLGLDIAVDTALPERRLGWQRREEQT